MELNEPAADKACEAIFRSTAGIKERTFDGAASQQRAPYFLRCDNRPGGRGMMKGFRVQIPSGFSIFVHLCKYTYVYPFVCISICREKSRREKSTVSASQDRNDQICRKQSKAKQATQSNSSSSNKSKKKEQLGGGGDNKELVRRVMTRFQKEK